MELLKRGNRYAIEPTELALSLLPFKKLYNRDKTREKTIASKEIAWIYWMYHPDSSYKQTYRTEEEGGDRESRVTSIVFGKDTVWTPDELVKEAVEVFNKTIYEANPLASVLDSAESAFLKMKDYFDEIDMSLIKKNGDLVYNPRQVLQAIESLDKAATKLVALRKQVLDSISGGDHTIRGGVNVSKYNQ